MITDGRTDKASHRVACPQLKIDVHIHIQITYPIIMCKSRRPSAVSASFRDSPVSGSTSKVADDEMVDAAVAADSVATVLVFKSIDKDEVFAVVVVAALETRGEDEDAVDDDNVDSAVVADVDGDEVVVSGAAAADVVSSVVAVAAADVDSSAGDVEGINFVVVVVEDVVADAGDDVENGDVDVVVAAADAEVEVGDEVVTSSADEVSGSGDVKKSSVSRQIIGFGVVVVVGSFSIALNPSLITLIMQGSSIGTWLQIDRASSTP